MGYFCALFMIAMARHCYDGVICKLNSHFQLKEQELNVSSP